MVDKTDGVVMTVWICFG